MTSMIHTDFAPAERVDSNILDLQLQVFKDTSLRETVLDAVPDILMVLNKQRQLIYANQRLFELLALSDFCEIQGKRPGEILDCIHSSESAGGCGTTEFCRTCGAVNAILEAQKGIKSVKECRILSSDGKAYDFKVWATPYNIAGEDYTIFVLADISGEKRRQALERTFFHDVINIAGSIFGLSEVLYEDRYVHDDQSIAELIFLSSKRLLDEIQSQRILLAAENGEFKVAYETVNSIGIIKEIIKLYSSFKFAERKIIKIGDGAEDIDFKSDPILIGRSLGNMLKNALEATAVNGIVNISCSKQDNQVIFSVHNDAHMSREVRYQVYQRSFSTKGPGRGIGTYSIQLFTKQYLGGKTWFTSTAESGTDFYIALPCQPDQR